VNTQDLEQRCETVASHLRSKNLATEEEIKACYEQPGEDAELALVLTYAELKVLLAEKSANGAKAKTDADDEVLAALADEPAKLTVSGLQLSVYPKSFVALSTLTRIAERIDFLLERMRELEAGGVAIADELYVRVDDEVVFLYRALVLAATTEGPSLPFAGLNDDIEFPAWLQVLTPTEIQRIRIAYLRVNAVRLALLIKMIRLETGKPGPASSWATFFSMRSDDTHVPTPVLMRDASLPSQVAAALVATSTKLAAMKKSEARG
jgi:hypothetical protein